MKIVVLGDLRGEVPERALSFNNMTIDISMHKKADWRGYHNASS